MSSLPSVPSPDAQPAARTVRMWTGLLVTLWVLGLIGAVITVYSEEFLRYGPHESAEHRMADPVVMARYWHDMAVAVASAALAMVFIIGGTALILNCSWYRRVLLAGAVLQILATAGTQVWESLLPGAGPAMPGRAFLGALIGILLWNVIPVGILILVAVRPSSAETNDEVTA
jgi:hypothetical protein